MSGRAVAVLTCLLALYSLAAASGCGDDESASGAGGELTVSAAASLTEAFRDYGRAREGTERFSFAGSDELAAQIRQGARPDVYAAANTELPQALAREGLVEEPVAFATNSLVLAVPEDSTIAGLEDLERPGVDLVVGAESVPVGSYTREMLGRLPARRRRAILANVRSEEPDVRGVVGKLAQSAADAGFVYRSDVVAAGGHLRAIGLPRGLRQQVAYGVAVVTESDSPEAARAFVRGLLSGAGERALERAGLDPPAGR